MNFFVSTLSRLLSSEQLHKVLLLLNVRSRIFFSISNSIEGRKDSCLNYRIDTFLFFGCNPLSYIYTSCMLASFSFQFSLPRDCNEQQQQPSKVFTICFFHNSTVYSVTSCSRKIFVDTSALH